MVVRIHFSLIYLLAGFRCAFFLFCGHFSSYFVFIILLFVWVMYSWWNQIPKIPIYTKWNGIFSFCTNTKKCIHSFGCSMHKNKFHFNSYFFSATISGVCSLNVCIYIIHNYVQLHNGQSIKVKCTGNGFQFPIFPCVTIARYLPPFAVAPRCLMLW